MGYSLESVKDVLTIDHVYDILEELGGEPQHYGTYLVAKTISHGGSSHKLFFYENTGLFRDYSGDDTPFDVFQLVATVRETSLPDAISWVVSFCGLYGEVASNEEYDTKDDWNIFKRYQQLDNISVIQEELVLPEIDKNVLAHYPKPHILNWEQESIKYDVCRSMGVCYDPANGDIIIPHNDWNGRLVGIRKRTLVKDNEVFGKYRPAVVAGELRNHPLAFNLYGLDKAKDNIKKTGVAIIVESEKSVLEYMSFYGVDNSVCVAVCGSSISKYQINLLISCGAKEIVIGFDSDFQEIGDDEFRNNVAHLKKLHAKVASYANATILFDKTGKLLGYKDSPMDKGRAVFEWLWENRIAL